ncbi:hypothetical protein DVJ82_017945 [Escherichia coli]|nr:hypothetical protein DVJ82_017945 [Escherichia coli]
MLARFDKYFLLIVAFTICLLLTFIYIPVEPDVANSPLVWRAFLDEGFKVLVDWKPTPDSWYFTIYPLHFLLFLFMDDSSLSPLIISTAIFSFVTAVSYSHVVFGYKNTRPFISLLFFLSLMSSCAMTYGYIAHPFSHNSTNAFGAVSLVLLANVINGKSLFYGVLLSFACLIAGVSDPWFLASYGLPILITILISSAIKRNRATYITAILYISIFLTCKTSIIQEYYGWPVAALTVQNFDVWLKNIKWIFLNLGSSLNITPVNSEISYIISSCIWIVITLYSFILALKEKSLIITTMCLSVAAISAAFIISYESADAFSSRFIVNILYIAPALAFYVIYKTKNLYVSMALALCFISNISSYAGSKGPNVDQSHDAKDYISFLKDNNLKFGYSEFWDMANIITWKTGGDITITPVYFDKESGRMKLTWQRGQSFNSHRTKDYVARSPERKFISIRKGEQCPSKDVCLTGVLNQFGSPDSILKFKDRTILVYDREIDPFK